jgi:hypothetical protein
VTNASKLTAHCQIPSQLFEPKNAAVGNCTDSTHMNTQRAVHLLCVQWTDTTCNITQEIVGPEGTGTIQRTIDVENCFFD